MVKDRRADKLKRVDRHDGYLNKTLDMVYASTELMYVSTLIRDPIEKTVSKFGNLVNI